MRHGQDWRYEANSCIPRDFHLVVRFAEISWSMGKQQEVFWLQPFGMQYFPLSWPFLLALFAIFVLVVTIFEIGILHYAYERMGIPPRYVFTILLLSLLGSANQHSRSTISPRNA